ncbi:MAG: polyribonucleotide nucleotidyltransferase [Candidatus Omnitrophica bacterium]|nr:polyribonucleotide nucleotidyltransferase [Candidatus Omnitrophota bacterium]
MQKIEIPIGEKKLVIEEGLMAKQAHGSALIRYGDTVVLATAVSSKKEEYPDFFPLTCDYKEHVSAAGKIPGGFFKREGRPTERETLISRLTDRSIRPVFPDDYRDAVQIISQVFSADQENDPDILSIIGASASLTVSGIPFLGPVGAVKVGYIDDKFIINPTATQMANSSLELTIAGTDRALTMMEGWAKEISEDIFVEAVKIGFDNIKTVVSHLKQWKKEIHYEPSVVIPEEINDLVKEFILSQISDVYNYPGKQERNEFYNKIFEELKQKVSEDSYKPLKISYETNLNQIIRNLILEKKQRLDGRKSDEIREIECITGLLPRTHGSALFTRGQTQCLSSLTLGTSIDEQRIEGLYPESTKKFMLHYNFPSFSVGEAVPLRGPSRREIGHGALAERSLANILPKEDAFPYTIRIVANILESNGSSSMATVCASSLALMDGGVPIPRHVAGIALGMIKEEQDYIILTDIAGEEDHCGDMDFKFAGTEKGITGFQMDVKTTDFSFEILPQVVNQARKAHKEILQVMNTAISKPRNEISPFAPKIVNLRIDPSKIGMVIGPGGKNIRRIIEETGAQIDIDDSGIVSISSPDLINCQKAVDKINEIIEEPEVGRIYTGTVIKILPFGAVVKFSGEKEGLVHISEIAPYRVSKVEDVLQLGSEIKVRLIESDQPGKNSLSRKQALTKEETEQEKSKAPASSNFHKKI